MDNAFGSVRCGSFLAVNTGYNSWKITCDWMPEFSHSVECTRSKVADLLIRIQAENRRPQLEVVK